MTNRRFKLYAGCAAALATGVLFSLDWSQLASMTLEEWVGWAALIIFGLISESLALKIRIGKEGGGSQSSITFILIFASVILLGPAPTVLVAGSTWAISQFLVLRKSFFKALFNTAQIMLSAHVASLVFAALGGRWGTGDLAFELLPFVGFGAVFVSANLLLVSVAIALLKSLTVGEVLASLAGPAGAHVAYDLLVSPVALLVAVLFIEFKVWGLLGASLTLFFIRRSYLTNHQLQEALGDLLKVLVKAIETRDPYTSGHSMRVAALARRIAIGLSLPERKVEEIETAALLHDIGKIDQIYNDILKKPADLTAEERAIIESHASKGADLLRSLSSVSDQVIACVRHHHERIDGKGYPDRIGGDEIPLGARIIKVCDAIDAMLSDRPYRKALPVSSVKEQLVTFAGIQFDVAVVSVAVNGSLLADHCRELTLKRFQEEGGAATRRLTGATPERQASGAAH